MRCISRGGLFLGQLGDALELLAGVLVARPDALEVEHPETAELADDARRVGRDDAVHGRREQRQLEAVGTEGPGDVDVVRVAGAARRNDRDVIEAVGAAALLASTDLNFHGGILGSAADEALTLLVGRPLAASAADLGRRDRPGSRRARRSHEPLDLPRIDHPRPEMLGRLGAAGDREAQAVLARAAGVARGHVARQEGVAGADRGDRLERLERGAVEARGLAGSCASPSRARQPSARVISASRAPELDDLAHAPSGGRPRRRTRGRRAPRPRARSGVTTSGPLRVARRSGSPSESSTVVTPSFFSSLDQARVQARRRTPRGRLPEKTHTAAPLAR